MPTHRSAVQLVLMALVQAVGCGGAASGRPSQAPVSYGEPSSSPSLCPGWVAHRAPGGTSFALPAQVASRQGDLGTEFTYADGPVYLEITERITGLEGGSDAAAIDGFLAGLGDPASATLDEGWRVVSQGRAELHGRVAAERVIEIRDQIVRRELVVRAGPTFVRLVTMARRDAPSGDEVACFERGIVFAAPPN